MTFLNLDPEWEIEMGLDQPAETLSNIRSNIAGVKRDHVYNAHECQLCIREWPCDAIKVTWWLERMLEISVCRCARARE